MSPVPVEFDPVHVAANAATDRHMYHDELTSKDPMHSVLEANPEIYFVPPKRLASGVSGNSNLALITTPLLALNIFFGETKICQFLPRTLGDCVQICSIGGTAKLITRCQRNK